VGTNKLSKHPYRRLKMDNLNISPQSQQVDLSVTEVKDSVIAMGFVLSLTLTVVATVLSTSLPLHEETVVVMCYVQILVVIIDLLLMVPFVPMPLYGRDTPHPCSDVWDKRLEQVCSHWKRLDPQDRTRRTLGYLPSRPYSSRLELTLLRPGNTIHARVATPASSLFRVVASRERRASVGSTTLKLLSTTSDRWC
jgi:hypothetical protein